MGIARPRVKFTLSPTCTLDVNLTMRARLQNTTCTSALGVPVQPQRNRRPSWRSKAKPPTTSFLSNVQASLVAGHSVVAVGLAFGGLANKRKGGPAALYWTPQLPGCHSHQEQSHHHVHRPQPLPVSPIWSTVTASVVLSPPTLFTIPDLVFQPAVHMLNDLILSTAPAVLCHPTSKRITSSEETRPQNTRYFGFRKKNRCFVRLRTNFSW